MTSIGETLRAAREGRNLSLERVGEETNIAKRYLTALESEDFSVFPGDPYAIGFLRNYAEYLGLQSDELVAAFKNLRIQEQPVPIQELIPARKSRVGLIAAIVGGGVLALGLAAFLLFGRSASSSEEDAGNEVRSPIEYRVDSPSFEKRLYQGDSVMINAGTEKYKFLVARIDEALGLETPIGARRFSLGEEGLLDFDKDGEAELKLLVADLDKRDANRGALVRLELAGKAAAALPQTAPANAATPGEAATATAPATAAAAPAPVLPPEAPTPAGTKNLVLFEATKSPYPFVVSVTFRGPCMFRYEVDRRDRDERYYHKGETLTINANNAVKLWASNAQAAKVVVQASGGKSADLDIGGAGEIAVKRLAWVQGEGGGYALSVFDID